jgi:hypothetical protein
MASEMLLLYMKTNQGDGESYYWFEGGVWWEGREVIFTI